MREQPAFLPMTMAEAKRLGIDQFDIILISGDAYVDHPSFGTALVGRVLWDAGYSAGVVAQPDWRGDDDFRRLGEPRLFFSISSGLCPDSSRSTTSWNSGPMSSPIWLLI